MSSFSGGVRTLVIWLTLFFLFSTFIIMQYGSLIMAYIISHSNLYSWTIALRSVQSDMIPPGLTTVLFTFSVLAAGSLLATTSIFIMHAFMNILTMVKQMIYPVKTFKNREHGYTQ